MYYADGDNMQKIGIAKAKFLMRLRAGHFTLRAWHRKDARAAECDGPQGEPPCYTSHDLDSGDAQCREGGPYAREGMRRDQASEDYDDDADWGWEREEVQPPPRPMIIRVNPVVPPPQQHWARAGAPPGRQPMRAGAIEERKIKIHVSFLGSAQTSPRWRSEFVHVRRCSRCWAEYRP